MGPPIIHPVGPVAHPIDVESSNISEENGVPDFEDKPSLGFNFGKILNYGYSALKASFGYSVRYDPSSRHKLNVIAPFNIGTDIGKSPHEPNLLQGHGPFPNVNLKLGTHYAYYEIGRIAPFSKKEFTRRKIQ